MQCPLEFYRAHVRSLTLDVVRGGWELVRQRVLLTCVEIYR